MPKILMTAIKTHRYAGKLHEPGAQYEADGRGHARLMVALKNAIEAPPLTPPAAAQPAQPQDVYQTTSQAAESSAAPAKKVAAKKAAAKTSGYKRRDQVAED